MQHFTELQSFKLFLLILTALSSHTELIAPELLIFFLNVLEKLNRMEYTTSKYQGAP